MSQPPYPPSAPHGRPPYPPSSPQPHSRPQYSAPRGRGPSGPPRHSHTPGAGTGRRYDAPPAPPQWQSAPQQPAQQQAVRQEPPRQRKKWPWVVGAVVLLLVIIGMANGGGGSRPATSTAAAPTVATLPSAAAPAQPAESATDTITYEVTGDGVAKANNITYVKDSNFGQQQDNGAKLPWSKTIEFENGLFDAQPTSLVAQSGSGGSGSITCRILRNGQEVTSSTSSGPYAVVTCSGGLG